MSKIGQVSRRRALKLGAAAAALPLVHIRTAGAAGKVAIGFWDHWVPGGNDVMKKQVDAWAAKNKVEAQVDFITSSGNKLQLTGVAEAQAKTGHDALAFFNWDVYNVADSLEPIDDVMERLIAKNGAVDATCAYLAKAKGHWVAVPTSSGTQTKPPCARISWFKKYWARRAGDVPGEAREKCPAGRLDLGRVPEIRRGRREGQHDLRVGHAAVPAIRPTCMARCSPRTAPR